MGTLVNTDAVLSMARQLIAAGVEPGVMSALAKAILHDQISETAMQFVAARQQIISGQIRSLYTTSDGEDRLQKMAATMVALRENGLEPNVVEAALAAANRNLCNHIEQGGHALQELLAQFSEYIIDALRSPPRGRPSALYQLPAEILALGKN